MNEVPQFKVTIVFDTNVNSLRLRPSNVVAIEHDCEFTDNGITFVVQDDDHTDEAIEFFVDLMNKNLDGLKQDWSGWTTKISKEVRRIADLRISQIQAQQVRDTKSKYPIQTE